jgi:hypothetical protein
MSRSSRHVATMPRRISLDGDVEIRGRARDTVEHDRLGSEQVPARPRPLEGSTETGERREMVSRCRHSEVPHLGERASRDRQRALPRSANPVGERGSSGSPRQPAGSPRPARAPPDALATPLGRRAPRRPSHVLQRHGDPQSSFANDTTRTRGTRPPQGCASPTSSTTCT